MKIYNSLINNYYYLYNIRYNYIPFITTSSDIIVKSHDIQFISTQNPLFPSLSISMNGMIIGNDFYQIVLDFLHFPIVQKKKFSFVGPINGNLTIGNQIFDAASFMTYNDLENPIIKLNLYIPTNKIENFSFNIILNQGYNLDWNFRGCGEAVIPNLYPGFIMNGEPKWRNDQIPSNFTNTHSTQCSTIDPEGICGDLQLYGYIDDGSTVQITTGPRHPGEVCIGIIPPSLQIINQSELDISLHLYNEYGNINYYYNIKNDGKSLEFNLETAV